MNDEKHDIKTLVDQNEALSFYFDSMLMPDENDSSLEEINNGHEAVEKTISDHSPAQNDVSSESLQENAAQNERVDQLQAAKDFLASSRQRQQNKREQTIENSTQPLPAQPIPIAECQSENRVTRPSKQPNNAKLADINKSKVITKGPVSPKPREDFSETPFFKTTEHVSKKKASNTSIVFSKTNKEGKKTNQVLVPRSQRLASLKAAMSTPEEPKVISKVIAHKKTQTSTVAHKMETNPAKPPQSPPDEPSLKKQKATETIQKNNTQEAPNLDLSLFLPKIKTLSDAEIAQQIEALTQAAVNQAQLESDKAHEAQLEQVSQAQHASDDGPIRNIENAPGWAKPDFQVLLFAIAGLKMAVPLNELNGVVEWGEEYLTELPGHKSWYLGIIQNQGKNVPVIDTLQQVVPENRWPAGYSEKKNFKHIILIDNARWGLACETVLEVVTLKTDSVKWRSSRTKRRWLLGTVIEHMCALLDSSEFAAMLKTGDDSLVS